MSKQFQVETRAAKYKGFVHVNDRLNYYHTCNYDLAASALPIFRFNIRSQQVNP